MCMYACMCKCNQFVQSTRVLSYDWHTCLKPIKVIIQCSTLIEADVSICVYKETSCDEFGSDYPLLLTKF